MLEFALATAFAVIIGVVYLASASSLLGEKSEEQRLTALNDIGYTIQDEVILASTVDDGYERTLTLPPWADRFGYDITTEPGGRAVTLTSGKVIITYDLPQVDGSFQKGKNIIRKNDLRRTNNISITVVPG
jgi:hypothetical protein